MRQLGLHGGPAHRSVAVDLVGELVEAGRAADGQCGEQLGLPGRQGQATAAIGDLGAAEQPEHEAVPRRWGDVGGQVRLDELCQRGHGQLGDRGGLVPLAGQVEHADGLPVGPVHRHRPAHPVAHRVAPVLGREDRRRLPGDDRHGEGVGARRGLVPPSARDEADLLGDARHLASAGTPEDPALGVGHRGHEVTVLGGPGELPLDVDATSLDRRCLPALAHLVGLGVDGRGVARLGARSSSQRAQDSAISGSTACPSARADSAIALRLRSSPLAMLASLSRLPDAPSRLEAWTVLLPECPPVTVGPMDPRRNTTGRRRRDDGRLARAPTKSQPLTTIVTS